MFDLNIFSTSKGTPSGLTGYAVKAVRTLLTKLLHSPETGVVKLTIEDNTDSVPYAHLVALSDAAPYTCGLTIGDNLGNAVAVSLSRTTLVENTQGYFRMTGVAEVAMEVGLTPANGTRVYTSLNVDGVVSILPGPRQVGWILDHSNYDTMAGGNVLVLLEFDDVAGVQ
jgi:hypothetical protein